MRTRTALTATAVAALLALTGCSSGYTADDCAAAIDDTSTKTNRPAECQDISDEDYETLIMGYVLNKEGLGDLDEHPEDLLDYAEDGDVDREQ
ncbi:hypothetical protein AMK17_25305 [Streptomyces sp. CB00072]|uniref:hypothetical protein n=1 Tax=Streptomyces sp. CB00072 TaxID=1703928 RepID=UPI00093ED61D|nr:hypothetical protein [Streptomyces sp. CB00072]OKI54322.1 hypothetical protein AMK17_25305 [Streptomyces sp. CB00072]